MESLQPLANYFNTYSHHQDLLAGSVQPHCLLGEHTSRTEAWRCIGSTGWAENTPQSRSHPRKVIDHTCPLHNGGAWKTGSCTGNRNKNKSVMILRITGFWRCQHLSNLDWAVRTPTLPAAGPYSTHSTATLRQSLWSPDRSCSSADYGKGEGMAEEEMTPLAWVRHWEERS